MEYHDDSDRPSILRQRLVLFFQKKKKKTAVFIIIIALNIAMDLLRYNQILVRPALGLNRDEFFTECDIFETNHVGNSSQNSSKTDDDFSTNSTRT